MIIKIANEADRIMIAGILIKNGYTVRQTKIRLGNKTTNCIEAVEQERKDC